MKHLILIVSCSVSLLACSNLKKEASHHPKILKNLGNQYHLGYEYFKGKKIPKNTKEAAAKGLPKAQFLWGLRHLKGKEGKGSKGSKLLAFKWIKTAADQEYAKAQFILGSMYYRGEAVPRDPKKALVLLRKAANQGLADAQFILGDMYHKAKGVKKSYKKALYWYRRAAVQDLAEAQHHLGFMYYKGEGVTKNLKLAFEWNKKAALWEHPIAQIAMGSMYKKGEGVAQDIHKAIKWYQKVLAQTESQATVVAEIALGDIYYSHKEVKNFKRAFKYYKSVAEKGYAVAQFTVGYMYHRGEGTFKSSKKAFKWYKKAALQNFKQAQHYVGQMYFKGEGGVRQDLKKAAEWHFKAGDHKPHKAPIKKQ